MMVVVLDPVDIAALMQGRSAPVPQSDEPHFDLATVLENAAARKIHCGVAVTPGDGLFVWAGPHEAKAAHVHSVTAAAEWLFAHTRP